MKSKNLLIGVTSDQRWANSIGNSISKLGLTHKIISEADIESLKYWRNCVLVIVDTTLVVNLHKTIFDIHSRNPDVGVVVFSPAPEWQEAREALLAGAKDYELKSPQEKDIIRVLKRNLSISPHTKI